MLKTFCLLALVLVSVVVVLGAYTRLVHAGLGCPDWPTCYGHLWVPNESHEIALANERFQATPVETDKTWPEQIHRIFASSLGLVIMTIFGVALGNRQNGFGRARLLVPLLMLVAGVLSRIFVGDHLDPYLWLLVAVYFANLLWLSRRQTSTGPLLLAATLAGLVIVQGFFGMWTVTLKLWPQVVTAHLLGGFATLSLIWLLLQQSGQWRWQLTAAQQTRLLPLKPLAAAVLLAVVAQIALGGWTSANYAAVACPDFPLCQNQLLPPADFAQGFNVFQHVGPNYLGGLLDNHARTAIHLMHRVGALLVTLLVGLLGYRLWQTQLRAAKNITLALAGALLLQICLGISNVVFSLPLGVAVLHNAGGALLLLTLITINHRLRTVKPI